MNALGIYSQFAFSRNPIILREDWGALSDDPIRDGRFVIEYGGSQIYEGRFSSPLNINLSEIADSYADFFREPSFDEGMPLVQVEDLGDLAGRQLVARFDYNTVDAEFECTVIPGGISTQNWRWLYAKGIDIFQHRLLNPANNFFLTTRTADWLLPIKETELTPLYFFVWQKSSSLSFKECVTGKVITFDSLEQGVYTVDITLLRRKFFDDYKVLPSIVDVSLSGVDSCRIVIEEAIPSRDRYRLMFRNSLGVFEIIELTGTATMNHDGNDEEENTFNRLDMVTDDYTTGRSRMELTRRISIDADPLRARDIPFLTDMLMSEETYLLDMPGADGRVKVIPSIEDFSYAIRADAPQRVTINLLVSDQTSNISPDIITGTESRRPRIFTPHFSKQFN